MSRLVIIFAVLIVRVNSQQCIKLMTSLCDEGGHQPQPGLGQPGLPGKAGRPGNIGPRGPTGPKGEPGETSVFNSSAINNELVEFKTKMKNQNKRIVAQNQLLLSVIKELPEIRAKVCSAGMQDGSIELDQISASSIYHNTANYGLQTSRLNDDVGCGWLAKTKLGGDWLQIDLKKDTVLYGIATQGARGPEEWTTTYQVGYKCKDCESFTIISEETGDGNPKLFQGNTDKNSVVLNDFPDPITARYVRIYPMTYKSWPVIRMDLITC